jgi:hypothetical protein
MPRKFPFTFLLTSIALRCTMLPVPRLPGRFNPMKTLKNAVCTLGILALGILVILAIGYCFAELLIGGGL